MQEVKCYWDCGEPVVGYKINRAKEKYYVCQKHWELLWMTLDDTENFVRV